MIDARSAARALGGKVSGGAILCPGPNHRPGDRSLSVRLDPTAPEGFILHSHAGDDFAACRDHVRDRLGLPSWEPTTTAERPHFRPIASPERSIVVPVPSEALPPPDVHPALGKPAARWCYTDPNGAVIGYVWRFGKAEGAKEFRPLTLWRSRHGLEWRWEAWPEPRPLFGLARLAKRPDAPVIVCEGEKAAVAAGRWLPDHVAITSPNGSKSAAKADWLPLVGRDVVIWPDHDAPGDAYACDVVNLLRTVGARSVAVVDIPVDWPDGWDLGDELPEGITEATLKEMVATAKPVAVVETVLGGNASWSRPLPIVSTLPAVEPFCRELLPDRVRTYVYDVAERQQSPVDFVAVSALVGLSAMIGNRVRIRPKRNDDWEIVPNLWGAIVGRPSAMKSPAMKSALGAVYAIQDDIRKEWEEGQRAAKVEETLDKLDFKAKREGAAKALKGGDRDGARELLAAVGDSAEDVPCPRVIVNDATVEKLGELLNQNPAGLLLVRDELVGWLSQMQREEFQSDRAFYLESFNGDGSFTYDRIGRGTVHIENATLSLIGGVQPSRLAPLVRSALDGSSDDGLVQRLQLAVWPDDRTDWQWIDRRPDPDAREAFEKVFRDLHKLPIGTPDKPAVLRFSSDAQELFRSWMEDLQSEARGGGLSGVMESHILKMPKTVAGLALLFELIDGGCTEVSAEATGRALGWADYLRSHATRIYAAGETVADNGARLIVERRDELPAPFTARHVQRKGWAGLVDRELVAAALEVLVATNHVRGGRAGTTATGGRSTTSFEWNPMIEKEG